MEYKVKVNISESDYKKFNYDTYFHRPATIAILILIIVMLAHLLFAAFINFRRTERISEFFPAIVLVLLYTVVILCRVEGGRLVNVNVCLCKSSGTSH